MTAILTLQAAEKSFGSKRVLDGAELAVHARDRVGVVGLNGAGKSTLLKIFVGEEAPDRGLVTRRRGLTVAYVPQEPRFAAGQTVGAAIAEGLATHAVLLERLAALEARMASLDGDNLTAAIEEQAELHELVAEGGWDREHEQRSLAAALQLPLLDAPIAQLSGGERRRVALARALIGRPELLALDEPTNHLDARTTEWLEERLRAHAGALLLVTHDRYFLDRVATRIVEVDRGKLYSSDGGYTRFLERQSERLAAESSREQARRSFIRRELDWIRRGPAARTTKQEARIQRFDAAVAAAPTVDRAAPIELRLPAGGRLGKTILELDNLGQSLGGRRLFGGLTLIMKPGDRIGVVGDNGAGKTTLVRTILGQLAPAEGRVVVGQNTRIAALDQMRAELDDQKTVLAEVSDGNDHVFLDDGPVHVRTFLRMLRFDDNFADTPIGVLSGGERNRVQLARLLRRGGNLLILDEPTNDLDLITLSVLEDALVDFPGCALVVSHDRWFLDKIATGILAFDRGQVTFYEGNYTAYLARRPAPPAEIAAPKPSAPPVAPSQKRKLGFKEQRELDGIEAAIGTAETEVARLEAVVNDPALYRERSAEVPSLLAALDAARAEVDRLYARWQDLEAKK